MTRESKLATYWTAGSIVALAAIAAIAWMAGVFETAAK